MRNEPSLLASGPVRSLLILCERPVVSEEFILDLLESVQLRGWVRRFGDTVEVLVEGARWGLARLFDQLPSIGDPSDVHIQELADWDPMQPGVRILAPVPAEGPTVYGRRLSREAPPVIVGSLDRVTHRGHLRGWVLHSEKPWVPLRVGLFADGENLGEMVAAHPRSDLPERGLGYGRNGIDFALPRWLSDGRGHRFEIRPIEDVEAFGTLERVLPVPSAIRTPTPAPWIADLDAPNCEVEVKIPRSAERLFQAGRQAVLNDDLPHGYSLLREALDQSPALVFRDIGLLEHHLTAGKRLPGMRERLSDRWQAWFGPSACSLGSKCCKTAAWEPMVGSDCPWWPRGFESKALTKRYANSRGIDVAETYGVAKDVAAALDALGRERYVLKPERDSGRALYLMHGDLNLFDRYRYTRSELLDAIDIYHARRSQSDFLLEELLVQEGVDPACEVIPLDYKMHVFGGRVRLVHVDDRNRPTRDPLSRQQGWYARDWTPSPVRLRMSEVEGQVLAPPSCWREMVEIADRVGHESGAYVRVDMYATDRGPVLGEVTTYSFGGHGFSPIGDLIFSQLWELFEDQANLEQPLHLLARDPGRFGSWSAGVRE